jgi:peptidoglycan/LPS O-acetylase OafA/YrhL
MVFGVHLAVWEGFFGVGRPLLRPFLWFGYAGVDLFFVLSGFLITHTQFAHLGRPAAVPSYLFRRVWRIYPTFWVMMLAGLAVAMVVNGRWQVPTDPHPPGPKTLWTYWLTLAPCRVPNLYVAPAWSLTYEMMFYLAFAGLLVLPRRVGPWLLVLWAAAVGVAEWCGGVVTFTANPWVWHLLSPFVWQFLLGVVVAWLIQHRVTRFGLPCLVAGVAWAATWVLACADPADPAAVALHMRWRVGVYGPAAALMVYGAVAMEVRHGRLLPGWLRRVGDASYAIYLWHAPAGGAVYNLTLWWPHSSALHVAWLGFETLVCIGGGWAIHVLVEQPLMKLGRGRRSEKATPGAVTAGRVSDRRSIVPQGEPATLSSLPSTPKVS